MILVDTSVWVDHLRRSDVGLKRVLEANQVLCHPFIIGELACGHLRDRAAVLDALKDVSSAPVASNNEVMMLLDRHKLSGRGIGWVDVHLLASTLLVAGRLWTRDKRLTAVAQRLDVAYRPG